jgi:hypothetical protein
MFLALLAVISTEATDPPPARLPDVALTSPEAFCAGARYVRSAPPDAILVIEAAKGGEAIRCLPDGAYKLNTSRSPMYHLQTCQSSGGYCWSILPGTMNSSIPVTTIEAH